MRFIMKDKKEVEDVSSYRVVLRVRKDSGT